LYLANAPHQRGSGNYREHSPRRRPPVGPLAQLGILSTGVPKSRLDPIRPISFHLVAFCEIDFLMGVRGGALAEPCSVTSWNRAARSFPPMSLSARLMNNPA
jgi:hypothetical protein